MLDDIKLITFMVCVKNQSNAFQYFIIYHFSLIH